MFYIFSWSLIFFVIRAYHARQVLKITLLYVDPVRSTKVVFIPASGRWSEIIYLVLNTRVLKNLKLHSKYPDVDVVFENYQNPYIFLH